MRLLVDIVPYDRGRSGISVYAREVVRALARGGHDLTLLCEHDFDAACLGLATPPRLLRAPGWTRRAVFSMAWHLFLAPRLVRRSGCDVCLLLAANRRAFARYPIPTVAVVHDLSQYHVGAKYDAFRTFYIRHVLPFFVRRAHAVVAISKSTKRDLVQFWKIPESRVSVVYDGFTPVANFEIRSDLKSKFGTIFYLSRLEHPGKNHVNLIRAYEKLPEALAKAHPLVLAGGDWNGAEAVHAAAAASPRRDLIRLTGFVKDEDLAALWADAAVYVFPSLFEGFGLSLLEAMSAGVPCACSSTSSLGELGEGIAELFDPKSADDIASALTRLLSGDNAARIAAGKARAATFTWDACAAGLLAAVPPARVFGVKIDCTTMSDALGRVLDPKGGVFAFVNAHCLNIACGNADYRAALAKFDAVWPDGTGVRWAGRILGFPVPENVNGTDLFPLLADRLAAEGRSVYFYGARPGVAAQAAANAQKSHPGLVVAGVTDGYVPEDEAVKAIAAAKPDVLLVALGVPMQELWIQRNRERLNARAVLAVGGLLDFLSGRHARAPMWMRRLGIEWLHRLWLEPVGKFRRYVIGNPLFLWRLRRRR